MNNSVYLATAKLKKDGIRSRAFESSNFFDDENFQDQLVKLLVTSPHFCKQVAGLLDPDDFKPLRGMRFGRPRWITATVALGYWQKCQSPLRKLLRSEVLHYEKSLGMVERQCAELRDYTAYLDKLPPIGSTQRDFALDKVVAYKLQRASARACEETVELSAAGKLTPERALEIWNRVAGLAPASKPMDAAALLGTDFPEPIFHLNNVMPRGLTLLASRPKVGKSWLALQLAIATALGRPFLGRKVKSPGKVLYVALEDGPQRIADRLRLLLPELREASCE